MADNWYLLSLSGNTSLVHSRLPDFLNYLKINLGGLTETDYEAVTVNSVSYVPSLLVNISFTGPHSLAQLAKLAERNDTVLGEATQRNGQKNRSKGYFDKMILEFFVNQSNGRLDNLSLQASSFSLSVC